MPADTTTRPDPIKTQSIGIIFKDVLDELRAPGPYPPGATRFSMKRTRQLIRYPLPLLLSLYEQYGPIFTIRGLHRIEVAMVGPEATHFVTVERPDLFQWREGHFGELTPLIGDGILTTDGVYHDRARRLMMPAFHRERIEAAVAVMTEEANRAADSWRPGETVDVYATAREVALRIAMRALLGLDPDGSGRGAAAADLFEQALSYWGTDAHQRLLRGPGSPWSRMKQARRALDEIVYGEIARRRAEGPASGREDILSILVESEDEDGSRLADEEVRDQLMTLLFAGHDTSSSTIAFLLYELARHPDALARITADPDGGQLDLAIDETLRLYPPVWLGCRRSTEAFEFGGREVPKGAYVNYFPWATQRLPEVFPDPEAFIPERFVREQKAALPKGAYTPFGGGSRICIGKRFGQTVVKTVATILLQRCSYELAPGHELRIALQPTLSPRGGLPMIVREPVSAAADAG